MKTTVFTLIQASMVLLLLLIDNAECACPSIPDEHGNACPQNTTGAKCKHTCNGKYFSSLYYSDDSTCLDNGDWSPELKCFTATCEEKVLLNANACNKSEYGDECKIFCNAGYYSIYTTYNNSVAKCDRYGYWDYYSYQCESILKGIPNYSFFTPEIKPNMTDENSAILQAKLMLDNTPEIAKVSISLRGPRFTDDQLLEKDLSNTTTISYKMLNVQPSDVGTYIFIANGTTDDGRTFEVSKNVTLTGYLCSGIRSIPNGYVYCSSWSFQHSTCKFTCNEGYEMKGNETLHCIPGNETAIWPQLTTCRVDKYGLMKPVDVIPTIILGLLVLVMLGVMMKLLFL